MSIFRGAGGGGAGGVGGDVDARLVDEAGQPLALGAPVSLGVYALSVDGSVAGNDLASLIDAADGVASGTLAAAIAAGLSYVQLTVAGFPVRVRGDDGDPSAAGIVFGINDQDQPWIWDYADFTKVKLVGVGGTATVTIELLK